MCRRPEVADQRKLWGCDGPAAEPVFCITCPRCAGMDPACGRCEGRGQVDVHRCPASQAAGLDELISAYCERVRCEAWPAEGGMQMQTHFCVEAFRLMDSERQKIEAEKRAAAATLRG